jgi:hypothetical protein
MYFATGMNFFFAFMCAFIPESPRWYFGMERFEESRAIINKLGSLNGVKDFKCERFDEEFDIFVEEADFTEGRAT